MTVAGLGLDPSQSEVGFLVERVEFDDSLEHRARPAQLLTVLQFHRQSQLAI
jgi:hypothetical protein